MKILSTSKSKDSSLVTSEQLPDDLDLDELHVHEGDTVTSAEITKTAKSLADSMTKLLEELLVRELLCVYIVATRDAS